MSSARCEHIKDSGARCQGFAITGSTYCFIHDPAQAPKREDARRRGGQAGRVAVLTDPDRLPVRTTDDVLGLIEATINDVRAGLLDVRVANSVGYLAGVAMKAIELGELAARLDALEGVLEPERARVIAATKLRRGA